MNPDFIKLKPLEGELKLSHKKPHFGITVSTKEVVLHKPHVNYYLNLEDIVSITPFETKPSPQVRLVSRQTASHEVVQAGDGTPHYNVFVKKATLHNRSGLFSLGAMRFVIPIHHELMNMIGLLGRWDVALDM
ncbi:hypothetical protein [Paenibacillus flagellatus]|uniref:Uncharacterized protein n=1 Tax=Paenibacillus flagellatus TaxID=2211139 RepID=A0A2V5K8V2_9BACL|nr:hypothetical protein [Paenibacillus flagellatus]PYI55949.1 hypothetical protein DLM86_06715 [Paenibacillus flagellatus]